MTRNIRLSPIAFAAVAAGSLLLAGCGSSAPAAVGSAGASTTAAPTVASTNDSASSSGAADTQPVIHIKSFAFSAPSAPIHAGEKFVVVNDDDAAHTYDDVKGAFSSGNIPGHGQKVVTAPAAGTYQVDCDYHASMHGTLTVG